MAIYTDFFLASTEELQEACPLRVPASGDPPWRPSKPFSDEALAADFPTVAECEALKEFVYYEQKNLLPDRLEELHLMLGGDESQIWAVLHRPPLMVPGQNPFGDIFQLPSDFVRGLAELPQDRVAAIAEEWLGDKKTKGAVNSLRKMARKAIEQAKNMYLLVLV